VTRRACARLAHVCRRIRPSAKQATCRGGQFWGCRNRFDTRLDSPTDRRHDTRSSVATAWLSTVSPPESFGTTSTEITGDQGQGVPRMEADNFARHYFLRPDLEVTLSPGAHFRGVAPGPRGRGSDCAKTTGWSPVIPVIGVVPDSGGDRVPRPAEWHPRPEIRTGLLKRPGPGMAREAGCRPGETRAGRAVETPRATPNHLLSTLRAHRKPIWSPRPSGIAQRRWKPRRLNRLPSLPPPRSTRKLPSCGPSGFRSGVFW
jgi:hypothetical protein